MTNKYPTRFTSKRKELALIHILAEQLGMDTRDQSETSEYRSMLWTISRVRSASGLDWEGRRQVIDYLKSRGAVVERSVKTQGRPATMNDQMKKIEALLADMGLPWAYLSSSKRGPSMLQRLAHVDRIEWADSKGLGAIIAALAKRQEKLNEAH